MPILPQFLAGLVLVAGAAAQTPLFSADTGGNSVTITDTRTRAVVATIPVGSAPIDVALSPDGARAYTANFRSASVSVIDVATRAVIATIPVGVYPSAVGVSPDGRKLYVVRDYSGVLAILDAATHATLRTLAIPRTNGSMGSIAFTPDGTRAYVTSGAVLVLDVASDQVLTSFSAGFCANLAFTPDGAQVYCVDSWMGAVYGFDTATHTLRSTTNVAGLPSSIAITQDGRRAFVAVPAYLAMSNGVGAPAPQRVVQAIDLTTHAVERTLITAAPPGGIALTLDGTRVCIALPSARAIVEVDPATLAFGPQYLAGPGPGALTMAPVPARALSYGSTCTPPSGPLVLASTTLPWLGTTWSSTVSGLASSSVALWVLGLQSAKLPLTALLPSAVPGCELLVEPSFLFEALPNGGAASLAIPLPLRSELLGLVAFEQVLQLDGIQLSGSNGLRIELGLR